MIGTSVQPRRPRMTSTPSIVGQPEVDDDQVRVLPRRDRERLLPRRRQIDVVVPRAEVRRERAKDLRLVVDDEDPRHADASSRTTIVRPPPGVSSTSMSPPIASTKPLATASPRPTPSSSPESPSR